MLITPLRRLGPHVLDQGKEEVQEGKNCRGPSGFTPTHVLLYCEVHEPFTICLQYAICWGKRMSLQVDEILELWVVILHPCVPLQVQKAYVKVGLDF